MHYLGTALTLSPLPMRPATPPPPAKEPPGTLVTIWFGLIRLCIAGELLLGLVGLLAYRSTGTHTLSGNPWAASHFPGPVIWTMRRLTMLAGLVVGPLALLVAALPFRLLGPAAQKPAGRAGATAASLRGGLGAVPRQ